MLLGVMMTSSTQPIMIGKQLIEAFSIIDVNLESCPFTIVTSMGGTKCATSYTKEPLCLIFDVDARSIYLHFSIRCVVIGANNYDIIRTKMKL